MPLKIIQGNIHQESFDVVVESTYEAKYVEESLYFIDFFSLHEYANTKGPIALTQAALLRNIDGSPTPFKIYVVGPRYRENEPVSNIRLLKESYLNCLTLASKNALKSIGFPLISSGGKNFPKKLAFEVAKHTIETYLERFNLDVTLIVHDAASVRVAKAYLDDVTSYVQKHYDEGIKELTFPKKPQAVFHETLRRIILVKNLHEVKMYQAAHISKAHYHKIITGKSVPSRKTCMLLVIAMQLTVDEAQELMRSAGYTFSASSHFDLIVEFHLKKGLYDLDQLDQTLYQYTNDTLRKYE